MIKEAELRKERDYLKTVLYILEKKIAGNTDIVSKIEKSISNQMRYLWEQNIPDENEELYMKNEVLHDQLKQESFEATLDTQKKMIQNAYFARIDFDDGDEVLPVYIGIATLLDGSHFYIYDWRAPISSMFYDYELGEAEYSLPNGNKIKGEIVLKRQYKIEGDKIIEIFDTELQIIDNILKKMLSGNVTNQMKNIVKTIQSEQNKIIRKRNVDVLVVQGPAGSGKTSVAMHRIAYLLYAEREVLKNSNILIFSPNDLFSSYISGVLPEIGEDNVYQTTYRDYVRTFVKEYKVKGDMNDVYEELFTGDKTSVYYNSISLKFSTEYYSILQKWLLTNRNELLGISDIISDGEVLVSKSFLERYADSLDINNTSIVSQCEMVMEKISAHLDIKLHKDPKTKQKILKGLKQRIEKIKNKNLYELLYENQETFVEIIEQTYNEFGTPKDKRLTIKQLKSIFEYTNNNLKKETIPYEDVISYIYLKGRVQGFPTQTQIKQVVIDEAQDYTILQYNLISKMFPHAKFTLLGDTNQAIMQMAQHKNYDSIINLISRTRPDLRAETCYLAKTYRSTYEINTFSKQIAADKLGYKQVERHGDSVEIKADTSDYVNSKLFEDALKIKKKYPATAIIFKTEREVLEAKRQLETAKLDKKYIFVTKDSEIYETEKVIVISSYLAKGLEFDAVLVADANEENYPKEYANLFYVVCTRALHKLNIYHTSTRSSLIEVPTEDGIAVFE